MQSDDTTLPSPSSRGFRGFERYLTHLAGDWRRRIRDATPVTDFLREHVTDAWINSLTPGQFDYLERTLSAVMGSLRVSSFLRQGYTLLEWRPTNARQPGVRRLDGYGSRYFEWRHDLDGWNDHPYRLTHRDGGGALIETFIAEPYWLSEDGMRSLLRLAEEGWQVEVTSEWALHFPGATLRICLRREERHR